MNEAETVRGNRCIELEERMQYFKEELKSCNDKTIARYNHE